MPGQAKTFSTSTFAPSMNDRIIPSVVTTGSIALRKPYVHSTVRLERPLARAVRMKSLPRTPSMEARVMRASGAMTKSAIVTAGRASCLRQALKVSKSSAMSESAR